MLTVLYIILLFVIHSIETHSLFLLINVSVNKNF